MNESALKTASVRCFISHLPRYQVGSWLLEQTEQPELLAVAPETAHVAEAYEDRDCNCCLGHGVVGEGNDALGEGLRGKADVAGQGEVEALHHLV